MRKAHFPPLRGLVWLLALLFPLTLVAAPPATSKTLHLPGGTNVALSVYPAKGTTLLIWLPSESGVNAAEYKTAAALAKSGIEVWVPDLHAAYFLPVVPSSLQQIPARDVAHLITLGQQRGKAVYLMSTGSGAALALQAAVQLRNGKNPLRGAVLISPNLFTATPEPGEEATYLPVASQARLPIYILQPDYSPWKWRAEELQSRLRQGGSKVQLKFLPGVRDRFYYREDASPAERARAMRLAELILSALKALKEKH